MANYKQYQRSTYAPKPPRKIRVVRILLLGFILVVLYFIGRALFSTPTSVESNLPDTAPVANSNENSNTSQTANTNGLVNTDANTNINTNTDNSSHVPTSFTVSDDCTAIFSRGSGDQVVLTFNIGTAAEGEIQSVLESLTGAGVPADFFARGDVAEENPDLITQVSQASFPIYNLSYSHPRFTELTAAETAEELSRADAAISEATGISTKPFFRPPYGAVDDEVLSAVQESGYCPVTWTIDALDWSSDYTAEQSLERVLDNAGPGAIILMQASNAITAAIVPDLISAFQEQGYQIVSLDTLLSS